MATDHALEQTFGSQNVESAILPVALTRRIDEREIAWGVRVEKALLESQQQLFWRADSDKP